MAGDWIKMRCELQTHPKIVRILSATQSDKFRVIGGLHAVWSVFDAHSGDGILTGYTPELMDHIIGWPGFSAAMLSVGWLIQDGETLVLPEFDEHNSKSAKRRAEDTKRKRNVRNLSDDDADKMRTKSGLDKREDKRSKPPIAPKGASAVTFKTFLSNCKESGEKPISDYKPVFEYSEKVGLPREFVELCWNELYRRNMPGGADEGRRQKDWRKAFRNLVERNTFKLWWLNGDAYELTTAGKTAQKAAA